MSETYSNQVKQETCTPALEVLTSHQAQHTPMGNLSMLMHHHVSSITVFLQQAAAQASGFRLSGSPGDCRHAWHHHHVPRHGLQRSHEQQAKQRLGCTANCFQLCGNQRYAQARCYLQTVANCKKVKLKLLLMCELSRCMMYSMSTLLPLSLL